MSHHRIDVLTLGNAIVDVLAHTDEAFLVSKNVHKGAMQLIDEARAEELFGDMGPATVISGGSAANTAAGVASLGAQGRLHRQGQGRRDRPSLRPRPQGHRRALRRRPGAGRAGHRPQLHSGDARRRAHHEHLSGRLPEPDPRRRRSRHRPRPRRSSISKAISGIRRPRRKRSARPSRSPTRPATRWRSPSRTRSASTATGTSSWASSATAASTSCSPTSTNCRASTATSDPDTALAALREENILGRRHPLGRGRPRGHAQRDPRRTGLPGRRAWSTPPAPATCSRPASSPA